MSVAARDRLLTRAVLAGSAFVAAVAVTTGVLITKVAHAGATTSTSSTGVVDNPANGSSLPNLGGLLPNGSNQAPVGGSHGS